MNARHDPQTPRDGAITARKPRKMTAKLHAALLAMHSEGKSQRDAARGAGMTETALSRALRRPDVQAASDAIKQDLIAAAGPLKTLARAQAVKAGLDLMWNSPDHKVRAKMVELFMGEARQPLVNITNNAAPDRQGYVFGPPRDVTPTDSLSGGDGAQVIDHKGE